MKKNKLDLRLKRKLLFWQIFIIGFAVLFIGISSFYMYLDKRQNESDWTDYLEEACDYSDEERQLMKNAVSVSVGTYIESLENVDIKNSQYTVTFKPCAGRTARRTSRIYKYMGNLHDNHHDNCNYAHKSSPPRTRL
ncbi:MAG: hypothetical protein ACI4A5_01620 [Hominilimicola sp.]